MKTIKLKRSEGFSISPQVQRSFEGAFDFFRIEGPAVFSRLLQSEKITRTGEKLWASDPHKEYWFDNELLMRLRAQARRDIGAGDGNEARHKALVALYLRFCLRDDLAISKDWTCDFDMLVQLTLNPGDSIIALVGEVKPQPYYSEASPHYEAARAAKIHLPGRKLQYIIDFTFPPNQDARRLVQRHLPLENWG